MTVRPSSWASEHPGVMLGATVFGLLMIGAARDLHDWWACLSRLGIAIVAFSYYRDGLDQRRLRLVTPPTLRLNLLIDGFLGGVFLLGSVGAVLETAWLNAGLWLLVVLLFRMDAQSWGPHRKTNRRRTV